MATYPNLIDAAALARLVDADEAVVVDCRFSLADPGKGRADYAAGHIPGAVYAHLDDDLAGPITASSGRHPLPDPAAFIASVRRWGVSKGSQVVAYDDAGGAIAARLWWMLKWLGHEPVAVLEGGINAWTADGHPLDTGVPSPATGEFDGEADPSMVVDTSALSDRLVAGDIVLLDARDPRRFRGEIEPIDSRAGHVPGARNLPFAALLADDGGFRGPEALLAAWRDAAGETGSREVAVMCGSGVTACHLALAARVAGLPMPTLYPGSWSEWIRDPARPVAAGDG